MFETESDDPGMGLIPDRPALGLGGLAFGALDRRRRLAA
jgi:hypothetical protein